MRLQQITIFVFLFGLTIFYGSAAFSDNFHQYNLWDKLYWTWDKMTVCLLVSCIAWRKTNIYFKYWRVIFWFCILRVIWSFIFIFFEKYISLHTSDMAMFIFWSITLGIYGINYKKQ